MRTPDDYIGVTKTSNVDKRSGRRLEPCRTPDEAKKNEEEKPLLEQSVSNKQDKRNNKKL